MPRRTSAPSWESYAREIGHNLKRARAERGLSQEQVAHRANIAGFTYYKYEKGESKPGTPMNPELRTLMALCQVLGVELPDILPPHPPDLTVGS